MNRSPKINDLDAALEYALRLLTQRDYSAAEMSRKLKSRAVPVPMIQEVIRVLQERRYINDAARCAQLFRKYCAAEKYGLSYISQKLRFQHGFSDNEIQPLLAAIDSCIEETWAVKLLRQKFRNSTPFDRNKGLRFLAAHGFSGSVAGRAINTVGKEFGHNWTNLTPE